MIEKGIRLVFKQYAQHAKRTYRMEVVTLYAQLTKEFDLHFLADEVYALQTLPTWANPMPTPSVSVLAIDWAAHGVSPARIHALAGRPKTSARRASRSAVVSMLTETVKANPMSAAAAALFTQIVNDRAWCDWFLARARGGVGGVARAVVPGGERGRVSRARPRAAYRRDRAEGADADGQLRGPCTD
ncbi:hypothetical protein HWV62_42056 [Athelia sp. TMB]|nr:hypothetical protein HWV62_42056 [Athelia sp. TMB]